MVHCKACGVSSKARNYGITFHRFPKNESQRNVWISFINKDNESNTNFKCTMLCSQHFEDSCFDKTSSVKMRLKPFSVPTIHISRAKYSRYARRHFHKSCYNCTFRE
ncbi:THAP domain-containing protein 2 isoform X2 [Monomorium pharaonis]|uniref:THAP domain-containing protein 2 isoform X2 n=1 Tax=Monomorium pharaonis TaxID=307658 RepID=UPI001745E335|nr:THAP domain-containing protein 2 isoform X2 [Monomorium pharaonis]